MLYNLYGVRGKKMPAYIKIAEYEIFFSRLHTWHLNTFE